MIRLLAVIGGLCVVAAATHVNVMHGGGYFSESAPLTIAIAALVTIGMGAVGLAFAEGKWIVGGLLAICLASGEVYWLLINAEREIAAREALMAPAMELSAKRDQAELRLEQARRTKAAADAAMVSEAAKKDCRKNCADLLIASRDAAESELESARSDLAKMPPVFSPAPLSERLSIPSWAWDLVLAGLRSIVVMGASLTIGLALQAKRLVKPQAAVSALSPSNVVEMAKPGSVALFLSERVAREAGGKVKLEDVYRSYVAWCRATSASAVPAARFVKALVAACDKAGVRVNDRGPQVYFEDVRLSA